jgi:hypothetical protein
MRQRESFYILPTRILLNEYGASYYAAHNQALHRFVSPDGAAVFGIKTKMFKYDAIKKLLLSGYIDKIELQVKDIRENYNLLNDAIRLIFFSLYRTRIKMTLLESIYDSAMIQKWNHAHPKNAIHPWTRFSEKTLEAFLGGRTKQIQEINNTLFGRVMNALPKTKLQNNDEKERLMIFAKDLIDNLSPLIRFVLIGSDAMDRTALINRIVVQIQAFIVNLDIIDLASLLGIELVSAAERANLVRLLGAAGDLREQLENPERRKKILDAKGYRGSTIVVAIHKAERTANQRVKFRFSVYNDGADVNEEKELMENYAERAWDFLSGDSLDAFFKNPRGIHGGYDDYGMCFYYLNVLADHCEKFKVLLNSTIKQSPDGKVVTSLRFGL